MPKGAEARAVSPPEEGRARRTADKVLVLLLRLKNASPQALGSLHITLGPLAADLELNLLGGQNRFSLTTHSLSKTGGLLVPWLTGKGLAGWN